MLIKDQELVKDVMDRKVKVLMSTNAGKKMVSKEATLEGYGNMLFDENAMTNLRSLSEMV